MKQILFLLICILSFTFSCKAPKNVYYSSNNPYNIKIWIEVDNPIYSINHLLPKNPGKNYNLPNYIHVYVENLSAQTLDLSSSSFYMTAFPRLKNKAVDYLPTANTLIKNIAPNEKVLYFAAPMEEFMAPTNWPNNVSPFIEKSMKNDSYGDVQAVLKIKDNKIISQKQRLYSQIKVTNETKSHQMELFIYSNAKNYIDKGSNNDTVFFDIKNLSSETIQIVPFENFSIFSASLNQTSMMELRPTIAYESNKNQVSIAPNEYKTIFKCTLNELLYTSQNQSAKNYFWQWKNSRKSPAISPIVFQDGRLTSGTSLWFEVLLGNKKSSSGILELPVIFTSKKKVN